MPIIKVTTPPMMQPQRATEGDLAAMQRAWKSKAAKFPNARMKMVAQFQKMELGLEQKKRCKPVALTVDKADKAGAGHLITYNGVRARGSTI